MPLEHLADYTDAVTELFSRYGTRGTWYAHASVGCLHVRPILNLKDDGDIRSMRAIAEATCDLVKRFEGSHSGEHGDGISRSEFHERMFGSRLVRAFEEVKDGFDPRTAQPGQDRAAHRMDDRSLMRYRADYKVVDPVRPVLDWSEWGGFGAAVEMCNNNGTCRKTLAGTMCPSYRATREEQHATAAAPIRCGSRSPATRARCLHIGGHEGDPGPLASRARAASASVRQASTWPR